MTEKLNSCWIVTEGMAGTENQCIGLAEALGIPFVIKRLNLRFPWKQLTPWLTIGQKWAQTADSDSFSAPWPDLLITSGRKSIGIGRYIKKQSGGRVFHVHIQDPRINPALFDMVVVPQHDPTRGANVIVTKTALHRVTPQKIAEGALKLKESLPYLPDRKVAVLIGGASKAHTMTAENAKSLSLQLLQLVDNKDIGLMVTASRRTGEANKDYLRTTLQGPNVYFWDDKGDNPYFGFLSEADYIIVTEDSVSMVSEALATGKPVYIAALEGGARRLNLFHKKLQEQGYTRPFTGMLEEWSYTPPNDTQHVAEAIRAKMEARKN